MANTKEDVRDFWDEASCGEDLLMKGDSDRQRFEHQAKERYRLEPYIIPFGKFDQSANKKVLEIGVGLGADHQLFAERGADLYGIDLTPRAIENTRKRMELFGLKSSLKVGDAENLPFENNTFDQVYSWGVIHHSPETLKAASEIFRVLKPGGITTVMIYHKYSMVGYMLWLRYALMKLKPFTSLKEIYAEYLESPGTKAYTVDEARDLFHQFSEVEIDTVLTHGDLLTSQAGQRHEGPLLDFARRTFPRGIIRKFFPKQGLFMLITATKGL